MGTTVKRVPSVRAAGAFDALVPDGWSLSEWRGGSCAAIVRPWTDKWGNEWEVVVLPDDGLELPRADRDYETWDVHANRWDEDEECTWETMWDACLELPAFSEGDDFPTDQVEEWLDKAINSEGDIFPGDGSLVWKV